MQAADSFVRNLRPLSAEECVGEHRPRSLARAGALTAASNAVASGIGLISAIVLSRLVDPSAFGQFGIVVSIALLLSMICNTGLGEAAIQAKTLDRRGLESMHGSLIAAGLLLGAALALSGAPLARFFGQPEIRGLAAAGGAVFALQCLASSRLVVLQRYARAEIALVANTAPPAVALLVSALLAVQGQGAWALMGGLAANAAAQHAILAYFIRFDMPLWPRVRADGAFWRFGARNSIGQLSSYLAHNLHIHALGKLASATELGFFNRAQSLFQFPLQRISVPIAAALFPMMAARQDDRDAISLMTIRANWLAAFPLIPFCAVVIAYGDTLVAFLLGPKWTVAGETIRWIAAMQIPALLGLTFGKANTAIGRPARDLALGAALIPILAYGLYRTAPFGAVATAQFLTCFRFATLPFYVAVSVSAAGFRSRWIVCRTAQLAMFSAVLTAVAIGVRKALEATLFDNPLLSLGIAAAAMIGCQALLYLSSETGRFVLRWIGAKLRLFGGERCDGAAASSTDLRQENAPEEPESASPSTSRSASR